MLSVRRDGDGFSVATDQGAWHAAHVVVATGWCDRPHVPRVAAGLSSSIAQLTPSTYRNPDQLPPGNVLVVGASASGVQLADELAGAGRHVALAAGSHTRIPRRYRGLDIFWWLDQMGTFTKTIDALPDPERARREPSLQLVGRPDGRSLDLVSLEAAGVRLSGRLVGIDGTAVRFADDLPATSAAADARMERVLDDIDGFIDERGLDREVLPRRSLPRAPPSRRRHRARPPTRRHRHGHLGDRLRAGLPVAPRPGAGPPGRDPPAPRRDVRARPLRARAALPAHAATPTSSTGSATTPPSSPTTSPNASARSSGSPADKDQTCTPPPSSTSPSSVPESLEPPPRMLLARAGLKVVVLDRTTYGNDTLSTHALMRAGVMQLSRWGLLDAVIASRHSGGATDDVLRRTGPTRHLDQAGLRRGRALRPPPHRARPDAGRRGSRRRSRHPLRGHRGRSAARRRRPGDRSRGPRRPRRRRRHPRPPGGGSRRLGLERGRVGRGRDPAARAVRGVGRLRLLGGPRPRRVRVVLPARA